MSVNGDPVATQSNIREVKRGIAMAAALQTPVIEPGKDNAVRVSAAGIMGRSGISAGYARRLTDGLSVDVEAATEDTFSDGAVRGGVNYSF